MHLEMIAAGWFGGDRGKVWVWAKGSVRIATPFTLIGCRATVMAPTTVVRIVEYELLGNY